MYWEDPNTTKALSKANGVVKAYMRGLVMAKDEGGSKQS